MGSAAYGVWDLLGPGIEPASLALAGGLSTLDRRGSPRLPLPDDTAPRKIIRRSAQETGISSCFLIQPFIYVSTDSWVFIVFFGL